MMFKKVPDKSALIAHRRLSVQQQKIALKKFEKELQALYDRYFIRVARLISNPAGSSKTDAINLIDASKTIAELSQVLIDSGFEDVIGAYVDEFPTLTRRALGYYEAFGVKPSLAGIDEESLHAIVSFGETELTSHINAALVSPVQSHLFQAAVGNVARAELVATILETSNIASTARAEVLVDDIYAQFQRSVTVQKADVLNMEVFQYLGPDDAITSDQCETMLHINRHGIEGFLYKDEITIDLDPNLTRNPLIGGGHPRCRHQWSPVTEDYAVSLGFVPRAKVQAEEAA
jgi:hypothetical protein